MRIVIFVILAVLVTACNTRKLAVVKLNGKYGCIDRKGHVVIQPKWDFVFTDNKGKLIEVKKDSLYGFVNKKDEVVIQPQYEEADLFSEGLALVANDKLQYGYINLKGDTVIDFQFQENAWGNFSKGFADVILNERSGYIDKTGSIVIPLVFEICYPFKSDIAVVMDTSYNFKLITKSGKMLDYNDKNIGNKKILPPRNSYPGSFKTERGQGRKNGKGKVVVPPIYNVTGNLSDHMYIVQDKNSKWGAYTDKGKLAVVPKFDIIWHYREGLANFKLNGKWGYVDKKGKIVIDPIFEEANQFRNGLAYVVINGKAGFINKRGKFAIQPIFEVYNSSGF